ncbi:hypothetical protein BGZ88_006174, partial [Linnemannia elongata]
MFEMFKRLWQQSCHLHLNTRIILRGTRAHALHILCSPVLARRRILASHASIRRRYATIRRRYATIRRRVLTHYILTCRTPTHHTFTLHIFGRLISNPYRIAAYILVPIVNQYLPSQRAKDDPS